MAKKMIAAVIVILLIGLVVGLNSQMQKNTVIDKDDDDDDNQPAQSQQVAKPAPPPALKASPSTYMPNTASTAPVEEAMVGDPKATTILTVGYTWTPGLQVKQDALKKIIADAESWGGGSGRQAQIVCVDIPTNQRTYPQDSAVPVGVSVNGKPVAGLIGNPGENITPDAFGKAITSLK